MDTDDDDDDFEASHVGTEQFRVKSRLIDPSLKSCS